MASTTTGHPIGDAVLPAALRLVGAVRDGDPRQITEAIAQAREAADSDYWRTALLLVVAGLVPDGDSPGVLLAWNDHQECPR